MVKWWPFGRKERERLDELERRVELAFGESAMREANVIEARTQTARIRGAVQKKHVSNELRHRYFDGMPVGKADVAPIEASLEIIEHYGFEQYVPQIEHEPSAVVTLEDISREPERYLFKLRKGQMSFPLGLRYDWLKESLGATNWMVHNGRVKFAEGELTGYRNEHRIIKESMALARMDHSELPGWIDMRMTDFLHNAQGLMTYLESRGAPEGARRVGMTREVLIRAMELIGSTRIGNTADLLTETSSSYQTDPQDYVRHAFLTSLAGMSELDAQQLLPLYSPESFRVLASKRTAELISRDMKKGGLFGAISSDMEKLTVGESVVLACYFARSIIDRYATLEDQIKGASFGQRDTMGKCSDYTGLAVHYLNEYLIPLHPEQFQGWRFGYETSSVGNSYSHCFLKAIKEDPTGGFTVYFIDPTELSKKGLSAMKTPDKIVKYADASRIPFEIVRTAEELMAKPIE